MTVRYAEGTVFGLTRTNICTQPADEPLSVYGLTLL